MKIKTKYSIGDIVIIIYDNNLAIAEIIEIEFHKTRYSKELKYCLMILNGDNTPYAVKMWVIESNICCKYLTRNAKRLMLKCLSKANEKD